MGSGIRAVLFDLDDTIYEERLYVRGGFSAVAHFLEHRGVGSAVQTLTLLERVHHHEGREQVFQKLSARLGFPADWIPALVEVHRSHEPDIRLAADAVHVLPRLKLQYRLGCVTDGWATVQRNKLKALDVWTLFDAVVVADDYGRDRWKPDPFPFQRCCELLGLAPEAAIFVGDNPERDMRGARKAGLRAIRVRRPGGYFEQDDASDPECAPHCIVRDLVELEQVLRTL
jgi:putative hydrolase of the HAD superfamily